MYIYFLRERPFPAGVFPEDGLVDHYDYPNPIFDPMDQHMIYGYVVYDRKLTKGEISTYDLLPQEA